MANLKISLRKKGTSSFEGGDKLLTETDWGFILNKPATFVPDPHGHTISEITGLQGDLNNRVTYKGLLGTTDLNTLNTEAAQGIYSQNSNANATLARNYPTASSGAGLLRVYWTGANTGVIQEYNNHIDGRIYVRAYQGSSRIRCATIADRSWLTESTPSNPWVPTW